jgi:hypothetical protein
VGSISCSLQNANKEIPLEYNLIVAGLRRL